MKKIIPILLVALAGGGFYISQKYLNRNFKYAGTLEATRVDLSSRVPTVISSIEVEEGASVEKSQLLASLACEDIRIAHTLATENFQRAERLHKTGAMSREAFDQVSSRKQDADARLDWCDIKSPLTGTVLARFQEPSEWVNPGTKVLSLANLSDLWAYIYVSPEVVARLKVGAKVAASLPDLDGRAYEGVIRKINEQAEFTPKNVQTQTERSRLVFGVKIGFDNPEMILKPGMTVEIELPET